MCVDERELQTLMKGLPGDAPSPSFDADSIRAASARAGARHRMRIAAGSTLAAAMLIGGGVIVGSGVLGNDSLFGRHQDGGQEAATNADSGQPDPRVVRPSSGGPVSGSPESSMQGDDSRLESQYRASRTLGCESVDRELAVALAGELPVAPSGDAYGGELPCAAGGNAGYQISDADSRGAISIAYFRKGDGQPRLRIAENDEYVEVRTESNGSIIVLSTPALPDMQAPHSEDLLRIANALADDL